MASTKHNDDNGYKRGARGIDGNHGENFHTERYSGKPIQGVVSGDHGGPSTHKGGSALQARAKGKGK